MGRTEALLRRLVLVAHLALSVLMVPVGLWLAPAVDRSGCLLGELEFGHVGGLHGESEWIGQVPTRDPIRMIEVPAVFVTALEALSRQGDDLRPKVRAAGRHGQSLRSAERRSHREALSDGSASTPCTSLYLEHRAILC